MPAIKIFAGMARSYNIFNCIFRLKSLRKIFYP